MKRELEIAHAGIARASFLVVMQLVQRRLRPQDLREAVSRLESAQSDLKALIAAVGTPR